MRDKISDVLMEKAIKDGSYKLVFDFLIVLCCQSLTRWIATWSRINLFHSETSLAGKGGIIGSRKRSTPRLDWNIFSKMSASQFQAKKNIGESFKIQNLSSRHFWHVRYNSLDTSLEKNSKMCFANKRCRRHRFRRIVLLLD